MGAILVDTVDLEENSSFHLFNSDNCFSLADTKSPIHCTLIFYIY